MSSTTVNVSFQDTLLSDIDKVAKSESRSRSELLREAARMYIERKRRWSKIFSHGRARTARSKLSGADVELEIQAHRKSKRKAR